jgi:hypothetical protein
MLGRVRGDWPAAIAGMSSETESMKERMAEPNSLEPQSADITRAEGWSEQIANILERKQINAKIFRRLRLRIRNSAKIHKVVDRIAKGRREQFRSVIVVMAEARS